ncbi:MAG: NUDIX domain-containing protein [Bryobacteraceae bacterium]
MQHKYLWELPAGRLDQGENPLQAARREFAWGDRIQSAQLETADPRSGPVPAMLRREDSGTKHALRPDR